MRKSVRSLYSKTVLEFETKRTTGRSYIVRVVFPPEPASHGEGIPGYREVGEIKQTGRQRWSAFRPGYAVTKDPCRDILAFHGLCGKEYAAHLLLKLAGYEVL